MSILLKLLYRLIVPNQSPSKTFVEFYLNFIHKVKGTRIAKTVLKNNKVGGISWPYYVSTLIKTVGIERKRKKEKNKRTSLVVQWLRLCASSAGRTGLIPGQVSSACHAVRPKKKKQKTVVLAEG